MIVSRRLIVKREVWRGNRGALGAWLGLMYCLMRLSDDVQVAYAQTT